MEQTKELKFEVPAGYEIDRENTNLSSGVIKFKPLPQKWQRNDCCAEIKGYFIDTESAIVAISGLHNNKFSYNVFATEKQAKSALAMARISQIMANDKRFGGVNTVTEEKLDRLNKKIK